MTERPDEHTDTDAAGQTRGQMLSGLRLVSGLTLVSRVTGLIRDSMMAALFGNGAIMDAFTVAFRFPNMARRLFGEGALTAAFLPALVREMEQRGRESAWRLASALCTVLIAVLLGIVILAELALLLLHQLASSADAHLLIGLAAVMVPYLVFICLAAQVSAVMHALNHFKWPAFIPVLLNLVWIAGLLTVVPLFTTPVERIYAISVVIVVGGVAQFLAPLPALFRLGFRFQSDWRQRDNPDHEHTVEGVKNIGRTVVPVLLGLSVTQFNSVLDSVIAWWFANAGRSTLTSWASLEPGTASALYFGQRMYQFPLGVLGIALGTVLFPRLSRHAERQRLDLLRDDLSLGLRLVVCIGLPASAGLCLLAEPLTNVLFRHGQFDQQDALQTTAMIQGYGCAVWAYCGLLILNRAFYAVNNQATPLRIGLVAMVLNVVLNLVFIRIVGGVGLALGTAVTTAFQVVVSLWLLSSEIGRVDLRTCVATLLRTIVATAVMSGACVLVLMSLPVSEPLTARLLRLLLPLVASLLAFGVTARLIGLTEVDLLLRKGDEVNSADGSGGNGTS